MVNLQLVEGETEPMVRDRMIEYLEARGVLFWVTIGLAFIVVIGIADYLTATEISFGLFYLVPVSLMTWFVGRQYGVAACVTCMGAWFASDALSGFSYAWVGSYYWNFCVRLGFFLVVTLLLSALKASLEHERSLSRTDFLTGAATSRLFYEVVQQEMVRLSRYKRPFTIVYLDLDNFKTVNDDRGHSAGDQLLRAAVETIRGNLRSADAVGRLGGDEFAILLPETGRREAELVASKLKHLLDEQMRERSWPVTFSMGVVTCGSTPDSVDDLLKTADQLMYKVKNGGKDGIVYSSYGA